MRITSVLFISIFSFSAAFSEVTVVAPVVPGANAQLLALLESAMITAGAEVESYLDDFGDKPLLFSAMTMTQAAVLPWDTTRRDSFTLGLGTSGAANLPSFDIDELESIADDFEFDDDIDAGASLLPVYVRFSFPLDRVANGLFGAAVVSAFDIRYEEYYYRGFAAGAQIGWAPWNLLYSGGGLAWTPLTLGTGLGFSSVELGAEVAPGVFEEEFDLDPDGPGPYPGETITVSADPVFDAGFTGWDIVVPLSIGTALALMDTFGLALDISSAFYLGASGLGIKGGEDKVTVQGYLSGLIDKPGSIMVDYSSTVMRSGFVKPRASVTLSLSVGSLGMRIPLGYGLDGTVTAGLEMEAAF